MTTAVVITGILMILGVALILTGIDLANTSNNFQSKMLAEMRARTCLEEGLNRVRIDEAYIGIITHTYSDGSTCSAEVSDYEVAGFKQVDIESITKEFIHTEVKYINVSVEPYELTGNTPQ